MERKFKFENACEYARKMENLVGTWEIEDYENYVSLYFGNPEDDGEDRYQLLAMTEFGYALWLIDFSQDADVEEIKETMTRVLNSGDLNPLEVIEDAQKLEEEFRGIEGFIEFEMLDMEYVK